MTNIDAPLPIRPDLVAAHAAALEHLATAGAVFDATTRLEIATVARDAFLDPNPRPPWVPISDRPELNFAYRLARHAATITESWVHGLGMDPLAAIEVVGIVVSIVPITAFARAVGLPQPAFGHAVAGPPTGVVASKISPATLNWFPVSAPADVRAAVVQALSALPTEDTNLWRLAAAQYMSGPQMADPQFSRGTLSRPQMELVAGRVSKLRECFY